MSVKSTAGKVGRGLGKAGSVTLKGAGIAALATVKVLGEAADIKRRDEIRAKLETIEDYNLDIAIEILKERKEQRGC